MAEAPNEIASQGGEEDPKKIWDQLKSSGNMEPKKTWPELIGLPGEEAKAKILTGNANLQVQLVPADAFVTMDFRENRVRVYTDPDGKVTKVPRIG